MTREEAKQRGEMLISLGNGDEWEFFDNDGCWVSCVNVCLLHPLNRYRRKPKTEYKPWTEETFPDVPFKFGMGGGNMYRATSWNENGVYFMMHKNEEVFRNWDELLECFVQRDGLPCGDPLK